MTTLRTAILVRQVKDEDKKIYFFGYAKGISREGLFIQTTWPKEEKARYRIEFSLTGDEEPIECMAEVVWRRLFLPEALDEPGMGLKFLDLNEKLAQKIDRWVEMH
jgi:uncharacterized protein (TIGR02266 family)